MKKTKIIAFIAIIAVLAACFFITDKFSYIGDTLTPEAHTTFFGVWLICVIIACIWFVKDWVKKYTDKMKITPFKE